MELIDPQKPPKEFQDMHDELYKKIVSITNGQPFNIRDPTNMRIILQSAMIMVEKMSNPNGIAYSGPEKKAIVISVVKWVISDLAANGKIDKAVAEEVILNVDFYMGTAIDLAIAIGKGALNVGREIYQEITKPDVNPPTVNNQPTTVDTGVAKSKCCMWW